MPSSLVVTSGKTGPDVAVTAKTYTNVQNVNLDLIKKVLSITIDAGAIREFDLAVTATMTVAISAGNYTVTIT